MLLLIIELGSLVKLNKLDEAYDELTHMMIAGDNRLDTRKLRAYIATQLEIPQDEDAVALLTQLIAENPESMKLVCEMMLK